MIDRVEAALAKAFDRRRARAIRLALEWRFWGAGHEAAPPLPHCAFCGERGVHLHGGAICDGCVDVARRLARAKYRGGRAPDAGMAISEARRALRGRDEEALHWLDDRLARPGPPGCRFCGVKQPWPREARADERCAICDQDARRAMALVVGPGAAVCVLCLEALSRASR